MGLTETQFRSALRSFLLHTSKGEEIAEPDVTVLAHEIARLGAHGGSIQLYLASDRRHCCVVHATGHQWTLTTRSPGHRPQQFVTSFRGKVTQALSDWFSGLEAVPVIDLRD